MMSIDETRAAWRPQTESDRELVRQELATILESPHFRNSKRYPTLLSYVVDETLMGRGDRIKERSLGVEVFHRPADYDSNNDTVVRFTAGEVRKRLTLYYHEAGARSHVQIVMPTGSYVPEFYRLADVAATTEASAHGSAQVIASDASLPASGCPALSAPVIRSRIPMYLALAVAVVLVATAFVFALRPGPQQKQTALDRFWDPVLGDHKTPALISTGSVVFDVNRFSKTATADKNADYPFVSMQMAAAIARVSGLIERRGVEHQIKSSAFSTITDMRERPLILIGAYNNLWTLRLLNPLRFYFPDEPDEAILDRDHKDVRWQRDRSVPYSTADDYALVGRFREPSTGSMVVFTAGLGRNGTEAAAQFITSPHYLQLLEESAGQKLSNKNIEVVLKVNVVEGKTGAPSIQAVHIW
ncbi:MAG: hypothetical protein ABI197_06705 [Granulicella sp.]